jgi:opacity protein-like surface antigen
MISKGFLTGCFGAALLAAANAQAQFYVRADGAYSKTTTANFVDNDPTTGFVIFGDPSAVNPGQFNDFGSGAAVSVGAGTRFAPSGRTDITLAYRKYKLDQHDKNAPPTSFKADITSLALMGNLYFELSDSGGVTPYIGGGLGVAQNKLGDVTLANSGFQGTIVGDTKVGFAWGVMLGFSFPVASHLAFDIAYRYMDLGEVQTTGNLTIAGTAFPYAGASGHLRAHELALGVRF